MKLPVKTILHPTDFSDCSRYAFRVAGTLAQEEGARLLVLHVIPRLGPSTAYQEALVQLPPKEYKDWLHKILGRFQVPDPEVKVEHLLVEGEPSQQILRIAQETNCDLIVMGTHRRTGLERLILGSVADHVLRKSHCPVVTVKLPAHYQPPQPPLPTTNPGCIHASGNVGMASSKE